MPQGSPKASHARDLLMRESEWLSWSRGMCERDRQRETDRAREWAIKAGTFYRVHVLNLVTGVAIAAGSESLKAGWG